MALLADGVSALFIDGKPTAGSAGTFPTINPATEEVLGVAADADSDDMSRAIDAARRAFDETDWSRNTELRVRCIRQLREAMEKGSESSVFSLASTGDRLRQELSLVLELKLRSRASLLSWLSDGQSRMMNRTACGLMKSTGLSETKISPAMSASRQYCSYLLF